MPNAGTVSAPEGSNQVDVLLHGILSGRAFDLAPGIELGGAIKSNPPGRSPVASP
jgi:hypothetical protein